jgi:hypothetical protein
MSAVCESMGIWVITVRKIIGFGQKHLISLNFYESIYPFLLPPSTPTDGSSVRGVVGSSI